ncbi:heat-inducible transcriptional repressor HrcA [Pasteuria penetrans]|uniref:heat-inducible transcriptional repressor HrcA n=1 Tax=Pasteuria penetrans TaxID=86005 RepID=UPI001CAA4E0E|nr:heat-inducible transcriptional repressor HrcA [Pasteuria penetrans]
MLADRQRRILWSVVDAYVASAEPVGSRVIAEHPDVGVSAATVRNEMADLETKGFLKQPHASAGRIPSQKGYRFYVDHLPRSRCWTRRDICALREECFASSHPMETVFKHATSILSRLTQCVTVLLGPGYRESRLLHLQLIPLSEQGVLAILVTDRGHVYRQQVMVSEDVGLPMLEKLVDFLNDRLRGVSLDSLCPTAVQRLGEEFTHKAAPMGPVAEWMEKILRLVDMDGDHLYASGTTQVLMQPEFRDREQVRALLDLMEEDRRVAKLLAPPQQGVHVRIGYENEWEGVQNLSVITASYQVGGEPMGVIGVIGPMRMDYGRVIGLLDFWAKGVSHWLHRFYE